MSTAIICYGLAGTGKTSSARDWQRQAPMRDVFDDLHDVDLVPDGMWHQIQHALDTGHDVWVNFAYAPKNIDAALDFRGHEVKIFHMTRRTGAM